MNVNRLKIILTSCLIMTCLTLLGGCGGGSAPPSTIQLTVEAANVPIGTMLGALQGIITAPVGVDMRTSASGKVLDGLITASGMAAAGSPQVIGNYNSANRQLTFNIVSPSVGFGNGACAVITFDVTPDTTVTAANFTVTSVQGKNNDNATTGAIVPGVTINLK